MFRRHRRCLPIESDSSEDESTPIRETRSSKRSCARSGVSSTSSRKNGRMNRKVPIITNEKSSSSESEEIAHPPRHGSMRALSDYDTFNSSDNREEIVRPLNGFSKNKITSSRSGIQTRHSKKQTIATSRSSSSDSSDSGMPIGFVRKKKRMKLCSSGTESNYVIPMTRLRSRIGRSQDIHGTFSRESNSLYNPQHVSNTNWRRRMSDSDESTSDSNIRPRVLRQNSRKVIQSNTSSSDSADEIPIRRKKNRRSVKLIIESDEDDKSKTKSSVNVLSDSDNVIEDCPICLNKFHSQQVGQPSSCDHYFCMTCLKEWAKNNNTCPVDRSKFESIRVLSSIRGTHVEEVPVCNTQNNFDVFLDELFESTEPSTDEEYWSDEERWLGEEVCCVCLRHGSSMMYCDNCYAIYHLRCINPPVRDFPVGPWYCLSC